jgi:radical SAM/Cys-rich protein
MHEMLPRLDETDFPQIVRGPLRTLQVNLGYRCNQQCLHCHVNAGPNRKEQMESETIEDLLRFLRVSKIETLDLTGGAPELHPEFRRLVTGARELGVQVIDRCNLTILNEPGMEDLAEFLAGQGVEITASLPCYLEENVNAQRGAGVYASSMEGLRQLNALGYGKPGSGLLLNLMYNPAGPFLPPAQESLERDYRRELEQRAGVVFNRLHVLVNMPIQRFGSTLVSRGEFDSYMLLLRGAFQAANLEGVMCRSLISVDWRGYVYDCDFNQMLDLPLQYEGRPRSLLRDLIGCNLEGTPIRVADHCYGCTAGQGSSCGGALGDT